MMLAPHLQAAVDRELATSIVRTHGVEPHWARRMVAYLPGGARAMEIAKRVVEAHDRTVDKLVALAEKEGVEQKKIDKALQAYDTAHKAQALVALLLPVVPSVAVLRALGGGRKARTRVRP